MAPKKKQPYSDVLGEKVCSAVQCVSPSRFHFAASSAPPNGPACPSLQAQEHLIRAADQWLDDIRVTCGSKRGRLVGGEFSRASEQSAWPGRRGSRGPQASTGSLISCCACCHVCTQAAMTEQFVWQAGQCPPWAPWARFRAKASLAVKGKAACNRGPTSKPRSTYAM